MSCWYKYTYLQYNNLIKKNIINKNVGNNVIFRKLSTIEIIYIIEHSEYNQNKKEETIRCDCEMISNGEINFKTRKNYLICK